jgi:hypothetical protein
MQIVLEWLSTAYNAYNMLQTRAGTAEIRILELVILQKFKRALFNTY